MISIIIPTHNEESNITNTIKNIENTAAPGEYEIIVSDGGSTDKTMSIVSQLNCKVISSDKGRGMQLNAGASAACGDVLLFLHADTILPHDFIQVIENATNNSEESRWGRFDIILSGSHFFFRVIEKLISFRSKLSGIATGDQAIFVDKSLFIKVSGYKNIVLMEDVDLSRRLKRFSPPICLPNKVVTSSRRWEDNGIIRTVFLMWMIRFLFFMGVNPQKLQRLYS